jgi:hypothetical protein
MRILRSHSTGATGYLGKAEVLLPAQDSAGVGRTLWLSAPRLSIMWRRN